MESAKPHRICYWILLGSAGDFSKVKGSENIVMKKGAKGNGLAGVS